jgi:hypothetical protein
VENVCLAARLGFEQLASRLPREDPYERTKRVIATRLHRLRRDVTNDSRKTSSSLASFASSFGHDTPAHLRRRFAIRGVRCGGEWAALSAAPNATSLASSAEGVFRALIAAAVDRHCSAAIWTICLNQDAVGSKLSSVVPKRSTSGDAEDVPCGTSEMFRTYASSRFVSIAAIDAPIAQEPNSSGAQAGSTPAGRAERTVEAQRRALMPPSTA